MRLLTSCLVLLLLSVAPACESSQTSPPGPTQIGVIDLNRATVKELEALPAIGPKHARSIIASRNARGGRFQSIDDLLQIDGIGPKTVDEIRPYVVVLPK
ncbi:MAG TPA: helix-hairpin-helix domain-containing protein [Kofleriaceae bacterium]|nr:helix-hairpin-helix domain-containing protein [Kofleriaceae bacterium]